MVDTAIACILAVAPQNPGIDSDNHPAPTLYQVGHTLFIIACQQIVAHPEAGQQSLLIEIIRATPLPWGQCRIGHSPVVLDRDIHHL